MTAGPGISFGRLALMAAAVEAARIGMDGAALQKAKEDEIDRTDRRASQREREEYRVIVNGPAARSRTKTYKPNGTREQERRRRQREKREAAAPPPVRP